MLYIVIADEYDNLKVDYGEGWILRKGDILNSEDFDSEPDVIPDLVSKGIIAPKDAPPKAETRYSRGKS